MKNKITTALISVGLAITLSMTVIAAPLDDLNKQKSDLLNKQNQNSSQISSLNKQINDLESSIESYDNQISNMSVKLQDTKNKIGSIQAKIKKTENALKKAEDDYNQQQALLDQRIKVIYINGNESYLSFILDSKGIGDFISRIETVKQISELDKETMTKLEAQEKQIQSQKADLESQNAQLEKLKEDQQKTLDSLNEQKAKEDEIVAEYNSKRDKLLQTDKQYKAQLEETNNAIEEEQKKLEEEASKVNVPSNPPSGPVVDDGTLGSKIVAYAMQFIGTPYQWGGNGPSTFDCSGFTVYVYRHFGIYLPRTSEEQATVGTRLSTSQLQKGDLVFFENSSGDVHHVGIYVGDGYYINAPHTGSYVKIAPISGTGDYVFGGRVR